MAHYNLASERVRIGLNQAELAEKIGCSITSVCKWEKDISSMPSTVLNAAATLFGCSADYLLDKTESRVRR